MAQIREQLSAYGPAQIEIMDETGLFFWCLPNLAYFTAGSRRRARGIKAMKAKDHVTLVLAVNDTWSHQISVASIGKAAAPFCFKAPRVPCPLSYFFHILAWMDGELYEK